MLIAGPELRRKAWLRTYDESINPTAYGSGFRSGDSDTPLLTREYVMSEAAKRLKIIETLNQEKHR